MDTGQKENTMSDVDALRAWEVRSLMREPCHALRRHELGGRAPRVGFLFAGLLVAGLLFALSPQALAANRYGVICLMNETEVTVPYIYRIGNNGSWQEGELRPNAKRWYWHQYDRANEDRSPPFSIKFDSDARAGRRFNIEYNLKRYAAVGQGCEYGKQYVFRYDRGDRRYIDLKSIN
jgi:hypothetical protein